MKNFPLRCPGSFSTDREKSTPYSDSSSSEVGLFKTISLTLFKNHLKIDLTTELEMLPIKGVSDFVRRLAIQHGVIARRTRMDDWADAVTRLAGDDVKQDPTDDLLVALTKKNIISGRQMVRLLTNHMKEEESVRSVQ